jgi:hypothetical protein
MQMENRIQRAIRWGLFRIFLQCEVVIDELKNKIPLTLLNIAILFETAGE